MGGGVEGAVHGGGGGGSGFDGAGYRCYMCLLVMIACQWIIFWE